MWKWNIYFRIESQKIRCPVEAPNLLDAIKDACRIMNISHEKICEIKRGNKLNY